MNPFSLFLCTIFCCWTVVFGEISISFEVEEEISGRQRLGNIAQEAKLNQSVTGVDPSALTYEIQQFDDDYAQYFSIDPQSYLYLEHKIDRENITQCEDQLECFIEIQISVTGGTYLEIIKAQVEVIDINDNPPVFPVASKELEIPEGLPDGISHPLPSASDRDSGNNANLSYHLEPTGTSFRLEIQHNLDGSQTLTLLQNLGLDRESWARYNLSLVAKDGGDPQRNASLKIIIIVTDMNDNRPVFDQQEYNVTINEDEVIGTTFLYVTASDRDIGENKRLSYSFTKAEPSDSILNSIGVNESTGAISIIDTFSSEVGPFILYLEAKDNGTPVKKGQAKVIINVLDINDNPPMIEVRVLKNGEIGENETIGTPVATVRVLDADKGINGESECDCDNENFTIHKLGTNSYKVSSGIIFDREVVDSYNITINCSDKGVSPLKASSSFTVKVKDENDNIPVFTQSRYYGNITENNFIGSVILRVIATDKDIGLNGKILYEIVSFLGDAMFRINSTSGLITAADIFDREKRDLYIFQVNARDQGTKGYKQTTTNVTVYVMDANDHAPKFNGDSYSMAVLENMNKSTSVGEVYADDKDLGDNQRVSYMIPSEYSDYPFAILDDGTVITTEILDRENVSSYTFAIVAGDHGNPPQETRIPVTVLVRDENDNPPVIQFPNDVNSSVALRHTTLPNSVIVTVEAYDYDEKENQQLLYSIVAGNDAGIFQIDENNGDVILRKQIFDGDIKLYTLTILVKDQGQIQHETRKTLHIRFYISNDTAVTGPVSVSKGQNIMIAIVISCVTLVLSILIIVVICIIKRKDHQKSLYNAKSYDQQKIMGSGNRNSNRSSSSRGSHDKMIYPENGYQVDMKKGKKEVSFSLEEEQDGNVSKVPTSDQYDAVSSFRSEPLSVPTQEHPLESMQYRQITPPPKPERAEDTKQRDIHRMTSLRVHQALIQSQHNNNNNNKQWQQPPQEEQGKTFIGLKKPHLDDSHSESSGEVTTSDSGRGGSEEDIRSSMTTSHDTDDTRSPNTSSSHPFYTSESNQPTFSSFHGNSVHKTGPILSSFLNKPAKQRHHGDYVNNFPMNDLSNPNKHSHRHSPEVNVAPSPRNSATNFPLNFGPKPNLMDSDPLLRTSKHSNLNFGNSFEDESVTGRSQIDDDDNTTTSGSYTLNDIDNDILNTDVSDMFYKPDTFV